jgi:hypothetical protein
MTYNMLVYFIKECISQPEYTGQQTDQDTYLPHPAGQQLRAACRLRPQRRKLLAPVLTP